jgi:FixJ family two-component response regulator
MNIEARACPAWASEAGMATSVPKPGRIIAIVDDDSGMQISLSNLLNAYGFTTSVYSSAEDWLERGTPVRVDCLLLDIHLGAISGLELQRRLMASGSTLPVIFMTARDDEATRAQALEAGCVSFLCKPFRATQLIDAIESATA